MRDLVDAAGRMINQYDFQQSVRFVISRMQLVNQLLQVIQTSIDKRHVIRIASTDKSWATI